MNIKNLDKQYFGAGFRVAPRPRHREPESKKSETTLTRQEKSMPIRNVIKNRLVKHGFVSAFLYPGSKVSDAISGIRQGGWDIQIVKKNKRTAGWLLVSKPGDKEVKTESAVGRIERDAIATLLAGKVVYLSRYEGMLHPTSIRKVISDIHTTTHELEQVKSGQKVIGYKLKTNKSE